MQPHDASDRDTHEATTSPAVESVALKRESGDGLVNAGLREHATTAAWAYAEHASILHQWAERFNARLFGEALPTVALSFDRERRRTLGTYRMGRDGLGLRYRLNLPPATLREPLPKLLAVLLHELVHAWEEVARGRARGGPYHTVPFREKARELGIPTCARGIHAGIDPDGPLARLLRERGVSEDERLLEVAADAPNSRSGSKLMRWACRCVAVWASSGTALSARCERCGTQFSR